MFAESITIQVCSFTAQNILKIVLKFVRIPAMMMPVGPKSW